ncbi:MAG: hypothetical protein KAT43_01870 [Nanoarchaeota archaeon]|nr:hypothetical protein [Nanoarchaeota archaeon]
MKKNKKGGISIVLKVLVLLIVLLAASFFLLYFEVYAGEKATQAIEPCLCRLSVDRVAATKFLETESRFGLDCGTRFVNIYKADEYKVKEKGDRIDYHISNTKELKDAFAREITLGCWEMGAGEDNPYPNLITLTKGRSSRCVITSQITVDQKVINSFGSSLTDFESHLISYSFSECGVAKQAGQILGDKISFDTIDMTRGNVPITLSVVWSGTISPDLQAAKTMTELGPKLYLIGKALQYIPYISVVGSGLQVVGKAGVVGGIGYNLVNIDDDVYLFAIAIGPADEVGKTCGQLY